MKRDKKVPPAPNGRYDFEPITRRVRIGDWIYDEPEGAMQVVAIAPKHHLEDGEQAKWTVVATDWGYEAIVASLWSDGSGWRIIKRSQPND